MFPVLFPMFRKTKSNGLYNEFQRLTVNLKLGTDHGVELSFVESRGRSVIPLRIASLHNCVKNME